MPPPQKPANPKLRELHLENFKAIGSGPQIIPLRPITLVFGKNSSGKSSIIHSLLWLHHMIHRDEIDVVVPWASQGTVDLGGFRQFRFSRATEGEITCVLNLGRVEDDFGCPEFEDLRVRLTYGTQLKSSPVIGRISELIEQALKPRRELSRNDKMELATNLLTIRSLVFKVIEEGLSPLVDQTKSPKLAKEKLLEVLEGRDCEHSYPYAGEDWDAWTNEAFSRCCPFAKYIESYLIEQLAVSSGERLNEDAPSPSPLKSFDWDQLRQDCINLAKEIWITLDFKMREESLPSPGLASLEIRDGTSTVLRANADEAGRLGVQSLDGKHAALSMTELSCHAASIQLLGNGWMPAEAVSASANASELGAVVRLLKVVRSAAEKAIKDLSYLAPLRTYPERHFTASDLDPERHDEGMWLDLIRDDRLRALVNEWMKRLGVHHELQIDSVVSAKELADAFRAQMSSQVSVYRDDITAARKGEERLGGIQSDMPYYAMENWDSHGAIENAISSALKTALSPDSQTLHLRDGRTGAKVSFKDIGLGTSQMIPVLVCALSNRNKLIAIEQPEIHLHPALQAELGDLFIESALGENGNQFILETHSEHLILRLLRRVRATTNGELEDGQRALHPSDISVLFVEPTEEGSRVLELPVTHDGDFSVPWPGGFFAERTKELF